MNSIRGTYSVPIVCDESHYDQKKSLHSVDFIF